jgi:hypothetical protein
MNTPNDLITATEARKLLGISTGKLKNLLADKNIKYYTPLLDKRKKLVSRSEIEKLRGVIQEGA